jgi:putative phosphoesterase
MTSSSAPDAETPPIISESRLTVEIAIISDTHLPRGSRALPEACLDRLKAADLIVHAGDFSRLEVLEELKTFAPVIGVYGNTDDTALRAALPEATVIPVGEGRKLAVVHDGGPAQGRLRRLRARFAGADAVVFGHSHISLHERAPDGFQIFNPGSPTDRRRQPRHTMGVCHAGADLRFELVPLD